MKLKIDIRPENGGSSLSFNVDLPKKHFNIIKESTKLITSVTEAVKKIQGELKEE